MYRAFPEMGSEQVGKQGCLLVPQVSLGREQWGTVGNRTVTRPGERGKKNTKDAFLYIITLHQVLLIFPSLSRLRNHQIQVLTSFLKLAFLKTAVFQQVAQFSLNSSGFFFFSPSLSHITCRFFFPFCSVKSYSVVNEMLWEIILDYLPFWFFWRGCLFSF